VALRLSEIDTHPAPESLFFEWSIGVGCVEGKILERAVEDKCSCMNSEPVNVATWAKLDPVKATLSWKMHPLKYASPDKVAYMKPRIFAKQAFLKLVNPSKVAAVKCAVSPNTAFSK
jgi:hypothetical protein